MATGVSKIFKGFISAINDIEKTAEVRLIEYDNAITTFVPFYDKGKADNCNVGDFVILVSFNGDPNDSVIL